MPLQLFHFCVRFFPNELKPYTKMDKALCHSNHHSGLFHWESQWRGCLTIFFGHRGWSRYFFEFQGVVKFPPNITGVCCYRPLLTLHLVEKNVRLCRFRYVDFTWFWVFSSMNTEKSRWSKWCHKKYPSPNIRKPQWVIDTTDSFESSTVWHTLTDCHQHQRSCERKGNDCRGKQRTCGNDRKYQAKTR